MAKDSVNTSVSTQRKRLPATEARQKEVAPEI